MTNLRDFDLDWPEDQSCPDCGWFVFRNGPRGGVSQNIECTGCLARFNVVHSYPELDPAHVAEHGFPGSVADLKGGKIVMAQRIPSEKDGGGEWREDMFPRVTAKAWCVEDCDGFNVRSISDTQRAAIINWLVVVAKVMIYDRHTNDEISAIWDAHRGSARVIEIEIRKQQP